MITLILAKLHTVSHLSHPRPRRWYRWTFSAPLALLGVIETKLEKLFVLLILVSGYRESFPPPRLWCLIVKADSFPPPEIGLWFICIFRYTQYDATIRFNFAFVLKGSSTSSRSNSLKSRNSLSRTSTGDSLLGNVDQDMLRKLQSLDEETNKNLSTIQEE